MPVIMTAKIRATKEKDGWCWSIAMPDGVSILDVDRKYHTSKDALSAAVAWSKTALRGAR